MKIIKNLTFGALAVLAATLLFQTPITRAGDNDKGRRDRWAATATFTKHVTDYPACGVLANMAGIVGDDVGRGTYTGELLSQKVVGDVWMGEALYHFHGSRHSFTALVHVEQTGLNAVITGVVTEGWLKGHAVKGGYRQIDCGIAGPDFPFCYEGALNISRDSL